MVARRSVRSVRLGGVLSGLLWMANLGGCRSDTSPRSLEANAREIADAVHTVLSVDREVYTIEVVDRLQNEEKVIKASQHWKELKVLPLPALMFRMGAERTRERTKRFSYGLLSPWPINKSNAPQTPGEKKGLDTVIKEITRPYYQQETASDGSRYLLALYPDKVVSRACIDCHNTHPDSPRRDFRMGDVLGAIAVRVSLPSAADSPSNRQEPAP
jgi:hypothetical protein